MYITLGDFIAFVSMLCAIITLVLYDKRKKSTLGLVN